jgi:hypothetical protein
MDDWRLPTSGDEIKRLCSVLVRCDIPVTSSRAAMNIKLESIFVGLPIVETQAAIQTRTEPLMEMLPDSLMKKMLEKCCLEFSDDRHR